MNVRNIRNRLVAELTQRLPSREQAEAGIFVGTTILSLASVVYARLTNTHNDQDVFGPEARFRALYDSVSWGLSTSGTLAVALELGQEITNYNHIAEFIADSAIFVGTAVEVSADFAQATFNSARETARELPARVLESARFAFYNPRQAVRDSVDALREAVSVTNSLTL